MSNNKGIGGHQGTDRRTDEWITPRDILLPLGTFDLDPCAAVGQPWPTANRHYTIADNGLLLPWEGRVWLNPPYSPLEIRRWMAKMADHREGMALVFARTETEFFHRYVWPVADSIYFIEGRVTFCNIAGMKANNSGGAPSVLIAYGEQNVDVLDRCGIKGRHVFLNTAPMIVVAIHHTWKAVITVALTRLDGEAPLNRIYDVVAQIAPDRVTKNKHYREKIRQTLQQHFPRIRKGTYVLELDDAA